MLQREKLNIRPSVRVLLAATTILGCMASEPALADCTADTTGTNVTCTGTSASYSNSATGVTLNADSTAVVTGPITLGNSAAATNAGTINTGSTGYALTAGSNSTVTNNGTIASSLTTSTSGAISLGSNSTVTNNGTMSAATGGQLVNFATNGTFINSAAATGTVSGLVQYGLNLGTDVGTFTNHSLTNAFTGTVAASGNLSFYNDGTFNGAINQTAALGAVSVVNDTGGVYTGTIGTGDVTTVTNNGTMTLNGYSGIGTLRTAGTLFTNNGTLSVGTGTTIATTTIYGGFTQTANGVLNIALAASSGGAPVAGTSYSQIQVLGANGTATLGGTLNLVPNGGFYPTGSTYDVIVADQGITGNFATVNGGSLPFITFSPVGIVTLANGQTAYEVQALRTQTYAQALASVATPNQLAIATGLQPLVATATANPTGTEAALVGSIDALTVAQAQTFLDSVSPAGYAAYADALRDQSNMFQRQILLRMNDQNSSHRESGPWLTAGTTFVGASATGDESTQQMTHISGGYDRSGPNYVVGLAAGYSLDHLNYAPGSLSGHNSSLMVGAYGAYHVGPLVASVQASYAFGKLAAGKTITINTVTTPVTASANEHLFSAMGTLGVNVRAGGLLLSPFAGVSYANGRVSGFTENGGGAADLTVAAIDASRTDFIGGATLTRATGHWRPYARVTYRSELGSSGSGGLVSAYFDGDPTTAFTVTAPTASKNEVDADVGMNVVFMDEGSLYLGYQGTYRSGLTSHGVMAGIRLEF